MKRVSKWSSGLFLAVFVMMVGAIPASATSLSYVMNMHKDEIITECRKYGVWPSVVVGMAGVETGVDSLSQLGESHNNYWGHTYSPVIASIIPGTGHVYGAFAAYPSFMDGIRAHLMWFWQSGYGGVQGVLRNLSSTPADAYYSIVASGYMAGTAGYVDGIYKAVAACGAGDWDAEAFPDGRKYIPYIPGLPCSEQVGEYDYPADQYNPFVENDNLLAETVYTGAEKMAADNGIEKIRTDLFPETDEEGTSDGYIEVDVADGEAVTSLSAVCR